MLRYVAVLLLVMMAWPGTVSAKDSILGGITRTMERIDRDLCARFEAKKCKKQRKASKSTRKTSKKKSQPVIQAEPEAPKVQDRVPEEPPVTKPSEPDVQETMQAKAPTPPPKPSASLTGNACLQNLSAAGAAFAPAALSVADDSCTVFNAVRMTAVTFAGGNIKLPDEPVLSCAFALEFASWLAEEGNTTVRKNEKVGIASLSTGPGFECRTRNRTSGGKMSEHAIGNAIDIDRILLTNGETIHVRDLQNPDVEVFDTLKALRAAACERFTTVLGPGADSAHTDHFHLDMAKRKGGYRICQ
jgi:hypothetical protein